MLRNSSWRSPRKCAKFTRPSASLTREMTTERIASVGGACSSSEEEEDEDVDISDDEVVEEQLDEVDEVEKLGEVGEI